MCINCCHMEWSKRPRYTAWVFLKGVYQLLPSDWPICLVLNSGLTGQGSNPVQDLDLELDLDELINLEFDLVSNLILYWYKTRLCLGGKGVFFCITRGGVNKWPKLYHGIFEQPLITQIQDKLKYLGLPKNELKKKSLDTAIALVFVEF